MIEKILSHRIRDGKMQFLVHFEGTDPTEKMWINKEEYNVHPTIMRNYQNEQFAKALENEQVS